MDILLTTNQQHIGNQLAIVSGIAADKGIGKVVKRLPFGNRAPNGLPCVNSFDPLTNVWTKLGLLPINKLQVGQLVWAFNEETGMNGYYPITAVHRNLDPELTRLMLVTEGGISEEILTTPEHPFYN